MHRSKKVNRKAKKSPKRKRSGLTALSRIHPQSGDRPGESGALGVRSGGEQRDAERRTFGTTMPQLQQLAEWLLEQGVESVPMEHQRLLDSPLRTALRHRGPGRPAVAPRSGPQDRHAGLPMDSVAA